MGVIRRLIYWYRWWRWVIAYPSMYKLIKMGVDRDSRMRIYDSHEESGSMP